MSEKEGKKWKNRERERSFPPLTTISLCISHQVVFFPWRFLEESDSSCLTYHCRQTGRVLSLSNKGLYSITNHSSIVCGTVELGTLFPVQFYWLQGTTLGSVKSITFSFILAVFPIFYMYWLRDFIAVFQTLFSSYIKLCDKSRLSTLETANDDGLMSFNFPMSQSVHAVSSFEPYSQAARPWKALMKAL